MHNIETSVRRDKFSHINPHRNDADHHKSTTSCIAKMAYKIIGILCLIVAVITALPAQEQQTRSARNNLLTENDLLDSLQTDCLRKDTSACIKYKIFNFVEKNLDHRNVIAVTKGVNIVKASTSESNGSPRAFSKNATLETLLMNRLQRFLDTHSIQIDLKGSDVVNTITSTARSMGDYVSSLFEDEEDDDVDDDNLTEEGRGKKKKKKIIKMLGPFLGIAALKAVLIGKLIMKKIALIAFKAFFMAKIALLISGAIIAKKLLAGASLGGPVHPPIYDVHPHHEHHDVHGPDFGGGYGVSGHGGGWGRSSEAQQLAYKAQLKQ